MSSRSHEHVENLYPLGRENLKAVQLLLNYFTQNLKIGQWELARACVNQLQDEGDKIDFDLQRLLSKIIEDPHISGFKSKSIPTTAHLSWLCLLELEKPLNNSNDGRENTSIQSENNLINLRRSIEFNILLSHDSVVKNLKVAKELFEYFNAISTKDRTEFGISSECLLFLQNLHRIDPELCHAIISNLLCTDKPSYKKNNELLSETYIKAVDALLDDLLEACEEKRPRIICAIYTILSLYDPEPYFNFLALRKLFSRIIDLLSSQKLLSKIKLLSMLTRCNTSYLIEEFCKLDLEIQLDCLQTHGKYYRFLSEQERTIFSLLKEHRHLELFMYCEKFKLHILESVVNIGSQLIKNNRLEGLETLLAAEEYQSLRPLLLLLGWPECEDNQQARQLQDILWKKSFHCRHPAISSGCDKLSYQSNLIQWCLEKAMPPEDSGVSANRDIFQRATELFKGFESHSVLYVLHHSTKLPLLNPNEVLDLLHRSTAPKDGNSLKKKAVRFANEKEQGHSSSSSINIEQKIDIAIYRSYYIIKCVMDAIYFCSKYHQLEQMNPVRLERSQVKHSKIIPRTSSSENSDFMSDGGYSTPIEHQLGAGNSHTRTIKNYDELYEKCVTKLLATAKEQLCQLFPLTLRVEVLEDIFSLLFVTHEDIDECLVSDSDSFEEEGEADKQSITSSSETNNTLSCPSTPVSSHSSPVQVLPSGGFSYDEPFEAPPVAKSHPVRSSHSVSDAHHDGEDNDEHQSMKKSFTSYYKPKEDSHIQSEYTSTNADVDSVSFKFGFIVNEYLVRDVCGLLKECIVDLSAARFERMAQERAATELSSSSSRCLEEDILMQNIQSSITKEQLQKRISFLTQMIHETQWRYELVSHEQIPKTPGVVLNQPVLIDEDVIDSVTFKHRKRKISSSNHSQSISDSDNKTTEEDSAKRNGRRSSRGWNVYHGKLGKRKSVSMDIIPSMLSSPESLLSMCIQCGKTSQATQVIQMFNLSERSEAVEVKFSQLYRESVQKISNLGTTSIKSDQSLQPGKLSMKTLAHVAATGLAAASLSNVVDDLLTKGVIPSVPHIDGSDFSHIDMLNNSNARAMILIDLLTTSCRSHDVVNDLMDILHEHLPVKNSDECPEKHRMRNLPDKTKCNMDKIVSLSSFLNQFESLLQYSKSQPDNFQLVCPTNSAFPSKSCIIHHLQSAVHPMSTEGCRKYFNTILELLRLLHAASSSFSMSHQSSLDLSPNTSKSLIKKNEHPFHTAMKLLIQRMEFTVPKGGLINDLGRSRPHDDKSRNYLLSLYTHVKELSFLLRDCSDCINTEDSPDLVNYFDSLKEGPISTLGQLMFSKKILPSKLEDVANKLSLNLTHIIVHSCCPKIPSRHSSLLNKHKQVTPIVDSKWIHNEYSDSKSDIDNPDDVARNILRELLQLLKGEARKSNACCIFDDNCARRMSQSDEFQSILEKTGRLKFVDLTQLQTRNQKIAFFGNLANIMMIHMKLKQRIQDEAKSEKKQSLCYESLLSQIQEMNTFAYKVGQLNVVSLYELRYLILRCGLLPPAIWKGFLMKASYALTEEDPWYKFIPFPEPRLLFILSDGVFSSPPVQQALDSNVLEDQLESAMLQYLDYGVQVDMENRLVKLPELLMWHKKDFISELGDEYDAEDEEIIQFIVEQQKNSDGSALISLLQLDSVHDFSESIDASGRKELPFKIETEPYVSEFGFLFNYRTTAQSSSSSVLQSENLFPSSSSIKKSWSATETGSSDRSVYSRNLSKYHMTPLTLGYVQSDSPLIATLVSLLCSDEIEAEESDELNIRDDYFSASDTPTRTHSASDMSLLDFRSYRYQKLTTDFQILRQHLLNYVIPIAAGLDPEILHGSDLLLKFTTSSLHESIRSCVLTPHDSIHFQNILLNILNGLFIEEKWTSILHIIHSIPEVVMKNLLQLQAIHDYVMCCYLNNMVQNYDSSKTFTADHFRYFYSETTLVRLLLSLCGQMPLDTCVNMLEMCMAFKLSNEYKETIRKKLENLKIYQKITECIKSQHLRWKLESSMYLNTEDSEVKRTFYESLDKMKDWRHIIKLSLSSPDIIQDLLIRTGNFETARSWASLNNLPQLSSQLIDEAYVLNLLNENPPNTSKAFMCLENLRGIDQRICLNVCKSLLDKLTSHTDVLFIAKYILSYIDVDMDIEKLDNLQIICIGAKALLCLPVQMRKEYSHLVTAPHLIIEQLLMNMNVDLAGQVYDTIKADYIKVQDVSKRFSPSMFNELVNTYTVKALEIIVIQQITAEKEKTLPRSNSVISEKRDMETDAASPPQSKSFLTESVLVRRVSSDYSGDGPYNPVSSSPRLHSIYKGDVNKKFIMPMDPPTPENWVPDSAAIVCMVCNVERFSMFNRRHHCRRCGRLVCKSCSRRKTTIKGISSRTCDDCYEQIFRRSDSKSDLESYHQRVQESLRGSPMMRSTSYASISQAFTIQSSEQLWKLDTSDEYNSVIKEEFYYEQAPSVSLCISILNLHSSHRECGYLMLKLCDDLSKLLRPIAPGVSNPEVDYSLVISMMKQLLFDAKMKFIKCGENEGMALCDVYQSRLDLMNVLVANNYPDLPTIQELTKVETVRRLRDKLIRDEHLPLAMNVSTKCGLDPTGVWSSWGMACLRCGDFAAAREKFSRCLKPPTDKNNVDYSCKVLKDIVEFLQALPSSGFTEVQMLLSTPATMKNVMNLIPAPYAEEKSLDSEQLQECKHYLQSYGTYRMMVDFLRENGYLMKAVHYVLSHKCSPEVFTEGLVIPAVEEGQFGRLQDQLMMTDPSLEKWDAYLTATCRYLLKKNYFNILYDFQLFMKDYIRAAMTSITYFYRRGSQSYIDLVGKVQHLYHAQRHMQDFLDNSKWGGVKHPLDNPKTGPSWEKSPTKDTSVRLIYTPEQVNRYILLITLQIQVTRFLERCLSKDSCGAATTVAADHVHQSQSHELPTLFGDSKARVDVVTMILLSDSTSSDGFQLAMTIVKEFKIESLNIFCHVARKLTKLELYEQVKQLIDNLTASNMTDNHGIDKILEECLVLVTDGQKESKESEFFIKLLRKESSKINAYILCGKLRSAYLLAVKAERVEDVKRIAGAAERMGQTAVKNICNKWLQQH